MGWAETAAFGYLRERLVGTAGPQGTFGYPATCAVVNGERTVSGSKVAARTFVPDLLTAWWRCFSGTPGTAQPPRRATSLIRLFQNAWADAFCARCCLMAPLRHADRLRICPFIGVDRKWPAGGQNDAIDPGCVKTQKSKRDEEWYFSVRSL